MPARKRRHFFYGAWRQPRPGRLPPAECAPSPRIAAPRRAYAPSRPPPGPLPAPARPHHSLPTVLEAPHPASVRREAQAVRHGPCFFGELGVGLGDGLHQQVVAPRASPSRSGRAGRPAAEGSASLAPRVGGEPAGPGRFRASPSKKPRPREQPGLCRIGARAGASGSACRPAQPPPVTASGSWPARRGWLASADRRGSSRRRPGCAPRSS